jgi:hypothetical protein
VFVSGGRPVNPITKANWEGTGVVPDVAVPAGQALAKAQGLALAKVLASAPREPAATEARWALEQLGPPTTLPAAMLESYAGGYGSRRVTVANGQVTLIAGRRPPLALKPLGPDTFAVEDGGSPIRVRFERTAGGRITGFAILTPDGEARRYARDG